MSSAGCTDRGLRANQNPILSLNVVCGLYRPWVKGESEPWLF
jgi:hypothetical protein